MARNLAPTTTNRATRTSGSFSWQTFLYAGLAILLGGYLWSYLHQVKDAKTGAIQTIALTVGLILFHLILVNLFERLLVISALADNWRYRSAFLVSLSFGLMWLVQIQAIRSPTSYLQPGEVLMISSSIFMGAFVGGLIASGNRDGYWENNSPPADWIRAKVLKRHRSVIGVPVPEQTAKRIFDTGLALSGLILSSPIWFLSCLLIWLEDPGPVLFVKNSVGRGGHNFRQFKFRTMVLGAEDHTGPVLSELGDRRILRAGRLLRKTALDELPQLINILMGEMSFVGPRPQRTVLVLGYLENMPEYAERHRVLPGLAGLAQVAGDYYLTPRQKLRFDRLYIAYSSLGFDLKLLLLAILITFWFRWQKDWGGRLPRRFLRFGSHS
jgi:lipopolysaccharide/colanic/teichoic acid biosynthesis glycosyltransferase